MNLAEIFIRRPIMTTLVMIAFLIFGIIAYRSLPVSDLPNVDFPTIQVSASLPGLLITLERGSFGQESVVIYTQCSGLQGGTHLLH
jgi:hypothetical protein